jgi:processive 1,2-diacylglycerol beta-glucosyltransferase
VKQHFPCILIVYSTFGDGHVQAAKAIKQSLASKGVENVHMIDLLAEAHPYWNAVSRFSYLQSNVHFPKMYGFSYHLTNQTKPNPYLIRLFHSIGKRKMKEIVQRFQPDAVIHTFPYLAMSELNRKSEFDVPTFTVLTDYVLHSRWIHPGTTRYFVANQQSKQSLMIAGIREKQISVSGIPIRKSFEKPFNRDDLIIKYGLDSQKKYVMISAGAYGVFTQVRKMIETVLDNTGFDILLICGKNHKLYQEMNTSYAVHSRIRVMGFVEQMEELMTVSSCLLTKAGGITLTEALSLNLPAIVYRPLPGQERGNADFLSENGAIYVANDLKELTDKLQLLELDSSRIRMARAMKAVYCSDAANGIVTEVLQLAEQSVQINNHFVGLREGKVLQYHEYH